MTAETSTPEYLDSLAERLTERAAEIEIIGATQQDASDLQLLMETATALRQAAQEKAKLVAVRKWAERAAQGYDAENYNLTATPQESCGLAVLAVLKARIKETTDE